MRGPALGPALGPGLGYGAGPGPIALAEYFRDVLLILRVILVANVDHLCAILRRLVERARK